MSIANGLGKLDLTLSLNLESLLDEEMNEPWGDFKTDVKILLKARNMCLDHLEIYNKIREYFKYSAHAVGKEEKLLEEIREISCQYVDLLP